jgi:hypothetical protein
MAPKDTRQRIGFLFSGVLLPVFHHPWESSSICHSISVLENTKFPPTDFAAIHRCLNAICRHHLEPCASLGYLRTSSALMHLACLGRTHRQKLQDSANRRVRRQPSEQLRGSWDRPTCLRYGAEIRFGIAGHQLWFRASSRSEFRGHGKEAVP